jgi:hypothetical protein
MVDSVPSEDRAMTTPLAFGMIDLSSTSIRKSRVGAVSELRAAAHLMQQGFDVFRCVAPHAPFDLVAHRDGTLYRVEVKTLSKPAKDSYSPVIGWPVNEDWDLLVICGENAVFQFAYGVTKDEVRDEIRRALGIVSAEPRPYVRPPGLGVSTDDRILEILREDPERGWTTQQLRAELESRGWFSQALRPTARVADVLRRLRMRGLCMTSDRGVHRLTEEACN